MVELLRDPLRNYEADRTGAIKIDNVASAIGDAAQVTSTASSIISNASRIRQNMAQGDIEQATRNLEVPEAELAAWNAKQLQSGVIPDSTEYQEKYRQEAEKIFGKYNKDVKWQEAKDVYTKGKKDFIEKGIAANIRYAAQQREEKAAAGQTKQLQTADTLANDYYQKMRSLGDMGNMSDGQGLTTETLAEITKAIGSSGTPQQRQAALTQIATRGGMEWTVGLSQNNPELADAIINNDDAFMKYMPAEFRDNIIEMRRQEQIDEWGRQRTLLESELQTTNEKSSRARELKKEIKSLDKKMEDFADDTEFDAKTISEAREAFKQSVEPAMRRVEGERSFAARQAAFEKQKETAANGIITFSPQLEWFLDEQAKNEKMLASQTKINPETGQAYEMSPDMSEKKGKWEQMRDDYVGYRNEMTKFSPLVESAPATKEAVNNELFSLLTMKPVDAEGNPTDFEAAAYTFLYRMARAPLTESERRDYANLVGKALIMNNEELQDAREMLQSADLGIYPQTNFRIPAGPMTDLKTGENLATRLIDERGRISDNAYSPVRSFDKKLLQTQAVVQTHIVNMLSNGVVDPTTGKRRPPTKQDVANYKKQMYDKAINDWYATRHVIDLNELDRKIANKEPAFQEMDGVIYEYKGRDSIGSPIWKNNSVLNTNRDFSRINKAYKMGQQ